MGVAGVGFTLTVIVDGPIIHPPLNPVKEYTDVFVGDATGLQTVASLKFVAGDQI